MLGVFKMGADADIVNAALAGKRSMADQARASGDYDSDTVAPIKKMPFPEQKPITPLPSPAPGKTPKPQPLPGGTDHLNWLQKMAKTVHDYIAGQKKATKAPVQNLNNTESST
jgi:hypothetical protein